MVFREITYYPVLGIPLIVYGGLTTLISLLVTASIMILNKKGVARIPVVWHHRMASLTIVLGLFHATFALLAYV
jgi:hypothetical protein